MGSERDEKEEVERERVRLRRISLQLLSNPLGMVFSSSSAYNCGSRSWRRSEASIRRFEIDSGVCVLGDLAIKILMHAPKTQPGCQARVSQDA